MKKNRTISGLFWNDMHSFLAEFKKDGKNRDCLLIATGCYLGLGASDLLYLKWKNIYGKDELVLEEQKTKKVMQMTIV